MALFLKLNVCGGGPLGISSLGCTYLYQLGSDHCRHKISAVASIQLLSPILPNENG